MSRAFNDVRLAVRTLLRAPAYSLTVLLTLALGIGAATAIFSFVHGLLLRPLPYPDPDRLVMVWQDHRAVGGPADEWFTPPDFVDLRDQSTTLAAVSGVQNSSLALTTGDGAEIVTGAIVSPEFFDVAGVGPARGRAFLADEDLDARVVVLTHGFWQRRFGGDPGIIGTSITLSDQPFTVVGVMPPDFVTPYFAGAEYLRSRVWRADESCGRGCYTLRVLARVAPGASVEQANAEAARIAARLGAEHATLENVSFRVVALQEQLTQATRRPLVALLGAVGFLLLLACLNIASLTIARNARREREVAIRTALGAGRRRLVRQLLTESVLLAAVGCALGVAVAGWGIDALLALSPGDTPLIDRVAFSGPVLFFAAATAFGCGVLFGTLPALQATRHDISSPLKEGGSLLAGRARQRARSALIVAELALALVLLVGAGLMMKSFFRLLDVDPGFRADNVLLAELQMTQAQAPRAAQAVEFYDRLIERLGAHPDVAAAGAVTRHPLSGGGSDVDFFLEGEAAARTRDDVKIVWYRSATPGYRAAAGLRMVTGRWIEERDHADAPNVVVINETMARRYWPGGDPIGRRISMGSADGPWWTIVGVVADVRHQGIDQPAGVELFAPYAQLPERYATVALRTASEPMVLAELLRREVRALDAGVPVGTLTTLRQLVSQSIAVPRLVTLLFGVFAASALLLAAIGIYGVMASAVSARTREIGVRIALGAEPGSVRTLFVRRALALVALGAAIGTAGALVTARALASLLYEVAPADPAAIAAVVALLALVSLAAGYLPAMRASRVDPMQVLRRD
jgi:putative ABC transport system permease protein